MSKREKVKLALSRIGLIFCAACLAEAAESQVVANNWFCLIAWKVFALLAFISLISAGLIQEEGKQP